MNSNVIAIRTLSLYMHTRLLLRNLKYEMFLIKIVLESFTILGFRNSSILFKASLKFVSRKYFQNISRQKFSLRTIFAKTPRNLNDYGQRKLNSY